MYEKRSMDPKKQKRPKNIVEQGEKRNLPHHTPMRKRDCSFFTSPPRNDRTGIKTNRRGSAFEAGYLS
jgi:hypothetical protein